MNVLLVEKNKITHPLFCFFHDVSDALCIKIFNKFQSYVLHGDVYHNKQLKSLSSKIWKYKGTIYKLRVDCGNESSRVLFCKTKESDLIIIHAFLKSTQKTPKKDAQQAMKIYQRIENIKTIAWDNPLF